MHSEVSFEMLHKDEKSQNDEKSGEPTACGGQWPMDCRHPVTCGRSNANYDIPQEYQVECLWMQKLLLHQCELHKILGTQ